MAVVGMVAGLFVGVMFGVFAMAMMQVSKEADNAGRQMDESNSDGASCADAECECSCGRSSGRLQAQREWTHVNGDGTTADERRRYLRL